MQRGAPGLNTLKVIACLRILLLIILILTLLHYHLPEYLVALEFGFDTATLLVLHLLPPVEQFLLNALHEGLFLHSLHMAHLLLENGALVIKVTAHLVVFVGAGLGYLVADPLEMLYSRRK